jgi:hypothetical protein
MSAAQWDELVSEYSMMIWEVVGPTLEAELAAQYVAAMTGPVSPAALAKAKDLARTAAQTLVRDLTEVQLKSMGNTVADALAAGKCPLDIAQKLKEVSMLDSVRAKQFDKIAEYLESLGLSPEALEKALEREKEKLLKARRETIARTEGSKAVSYARDVEATERGAQWKGWSFDGSELDCDVCPGNEADGLIPIDEPFSSGDMTPPAHPNCRCSVFYVTSPEAKEIAQARQEERIAETKAKTEAARAEKAGETEA